LLTLLFRACPLLLLLLLLQSIKLQQDNDLLVKQVEALTLEKADMLRQIQVGLAASAGQQQQHE
jgi:hypothetical protein